MQLNLSGNQLCGLDKWGDGTFTAKGIAALAEALRFTASVTKILVGGNRLRDEGTIILCDALRESTVSKVEELSLYMNSIGPDSAKAIAALCTVCASLTSLSLADSNLGDDGVEALSVGLKESKSLAMLDLSNRFLSSTRFGPKGAAALASAIGVMVSITSVR